MLDNDNLQNDLNDIAQLLNNINYQKKEYEKSNSIVGYSNKSYHVQHSQPCTTHVASVRKTKF